MRVVGEMTKLMGSAYILIIMALNTRANGKTIYSTAKALKHGLTLLNS
jgi:hypothetical protein